MLQVEWVTVDIKAEGNYLLQTTYMVVKYYQNQGKQKKNNSNLRCAISTTWEKYFI